MFEEMMKSQLTEAVRLAMQEFVGYKRPEFYTVNDVAKLLQITDEAVRKLCRNNELSYLKLGKYIRITSDDLQEYCKRNRIAV